MTLEIFELLIEMAGQQQHGVFQFALAVVQRALAEIADHDRGADRDRGDQQYAADDQPADRTAARTNAWKLSKALALAVIGRCPGAECRKQLRPARDIATMPIWK